MQVDKVLFENNTRIIIQARESSAQVGNVAIVADTGSIVTKVNGWEYEAPSKKIGRAHV